MKKLILIEWDDEDSLNIRTEGLNNTLELIGLFSLVQQEMLNTAGETLKVTAEVDA